MAGLKELQSRITSTKNTIKITRAMKLVSAAKLRKAQDAVTNARQYTKSLNELLGGMLAEMEDGVFSHPLTEEREDVRRIKLVVVGANRGLCGPFNSGINKAALAFLENNRGTPVHVDAILLGRKQREFFANNELPYAHAEEELNEDATQWPIQSLCEQLIHDFSTGEADEVHVVFTEFKSAMSQTVRTKRILPINPADLLNDTAANTSRITGATLFEPSLEEVFEGLLPRLVNVQLQQACLDSKASEHGSRMAAMESATKNANDLNNSLKRTYNKIRQGNITSEILDIVGGAEAIKG